MNFSIAPVSPIAPRSFAPPSDSLLLAIAAGKINQNPAAPGQRLTEKPSDADFIDRISVPMSGSWELYKGEGQAYYAKYMHYTESWFQLQMPLF